MAFRYIAPLRPAGLRPMGGGQNGSIFDLHRQMNRLFDDLFDGNAGGGEGSQGNASSPPMDVHQQDGRVEITAELPGVREEDIDLTVEDGVLILSGEKKSHREDSQGNYRERSYGRFERRITLPGTIDENQIEANFEHGVLTIILPLAERQLGRKIPLGGAKRQQGGQHNAQPGGDLGSEMGGLSDMQGGKSPGFGQGPGSDAENALIDGDSARVGGPGGEAGSHHTPGMPDDSSAAERAKQQG